MEDKTAPSRLLDAVVVLGVLLATAGLLWWAWLLATGPGQVVLVVSAQRVTAPADESAPLTDVAPLRELSPVVLSEPVLFNDDMGTGSTEFSAVTLNEDTNRLMIADDEGRLFEFNLDGEGVPVIPPRRAILVQTDDRDIEGIAWIEGNSYVLAHEATGRLSLVELGDTQTVVDESDVQRSIDTQVRGADGNGIEGVAAVETIDDVEFIVVVERPPRALFVDDDGAATTSIPLGLGVDDIADVWASPDGSVWVVSDVDRVVIRLVIELDGAVRQLQQVELVLAQGRFEQPEGVVLSRDGTRLYVVGESPGVGQFVLGFWSLS